KFRAIAPKPCRPGPLLATCQPGILNGQGERIEVPRTLGLGNPLLKSSYIHQITGIPVVSPGITRVEFQGALVLPLGCCPIPLMNLGDECERCVRFGESVIQFDG